jgi:Baseplate J-like protein
VAGPIIYLEVDDEITSAAARIRSAEDARVAVVLPYGSRVATSRINFRLLSRDALTHDKRLSLISADPATRALAASAGLPVFASVADYETAMAEPDGAPAAAIAAATPQPAPGSTPPAAPREAAVLPGDIATAAIAGETVRTSVPRQATPDRDAPPARAGGAPREIRAVVGGWARSIPASRTPWLIGAGILVVALLIAGVGVYTLLPSAAIVVTPRPEPVGPIEIRVVADPTASEPGGQPPVVPAEVLTVPVTAEDTFAATGTRVEQTKAKGTVRFENLDFTSSNRIAEGSIVSTSDGVRFRTDATITVGKADIVGFTIFPARASVGVTAVSGGPDGNVDAGTIVGIPRDESPVSLKVTNPDPTTGGTRTEIARVTQEDADGAMAALDVALQASFEAAIADPNLAPDGERVFPETGVLGDATPDVPLETLVGQEVTEFSLGASAEGTVVSTDPTPVTEIAEQDLEASIDADHELVDGSVVIDIGEAVVSGQTVTFPVSASAMQTAILDPDELKAMVLGKPIDEARAILAPFGEVELTVSPDWTGSVPGFESRVTVTISAPVSIETSAPSVAP